MEIKCSSISITVAYTEYQVSLQDDVITISRLLGHVHVQTTGVYTNVTLKTLQKTQSPLDLLR